VNDTDLLSDALFASPDDFTLAAALVEHLECERDMWRSEAEAKVADIQQRGRDARDIPLAASLLDDRSAVRESLLSCIRMCYAHIPHGEPLWVVIVGGDVAPSTVIANPSNEHELDPMWTLTVGATWLLRFYRERKWFLGGVRRARGRKR
jgi:hypothetical protein